ncbi:hypothetical protein J7L67_00755, partial [bacterium]|nr:hypothetical protein [bacterium]
MIKSEKLKQWYFSKLNHDKYSIVRILDVEYAHIKCADKSDLYVTQLGLPFINQLMPQNFYTDKNWYANNSKRLSGTSCVYRVKTKKVQGKNKEIVVKWNRMGQVIPGSEESDEFDDTRFNSPFEEFCLVMELRNAIYKNSNKPTVIHKPLAIYVPAKKNDLERMGRRKYEMEEIISGHTEIEIDMNRSYAVIYEWIKGIDAVQACRMKIIDTALMEELTIASNKNLREKGYIVRDNKPHHIIIRSNKNQSNPVCDRNKYPISALIDFELLERTEKCEEEVKKFKRLEYHERQSKRFIHKDIHEFHPHLHRVNHFGVDYIYGQVESTKGRLWVVGADPYLFDFFLPERWEKTKRTKISVFNESYYTITKDNIHIIWKISKVGMTPDLDPFKEDEKSIIEFGFNSPFEEVAIAIELNRKNIPTIYPRAIYMTGFKTEISENFFDETRYKNHKKHKTPDGLPLLSYDHEYIAIWGYWNGPDEKLARADKTYYTGINALRAYREGYIHENEYILTLENVKKLLNKSGIDDLNLRGSHLLLSLNRNKKIVKNKNGIPKVRIC